MSEKIASARPARHCGQNAVCTHFGNEFFASFHTTDSKSRLIPLTPKHKRAVENVRDQIWKFYERLKAYRAAPSETQRVRLADEFDRLT